MKFLSTCSGIEAASVAWEPLGWEAVAFSEIEKFPSAVLAHHWPDVPNLGDMRKYNEWSICSCNHQYAGKQIECHRRDEPQDLLHSHSNTRPRRTRNSNTQQESKNEKCTSCGNQPIDLLVGGTPCQSFSVAGLRKGLQDPRGNLTLTFLAMAEKFKPRWVVWENVPGVLSDKTNAFGQFLAGLGELGYGFAYRVLDAQHFGVPQRRRRVFVVGCLGDWASAASVLFEPESLCGDLTPSREAREGSATSTPDGIGVGSLCARTGRSMSVQDAGQGHLIPQAYRMAAFGEHSDAANGHIIPEVAHCIQTTCHDYSRADGFNMVAQPAVATAMQVRRLTPTECERLQGFPDQHTLIPWRNKPAEECPDGPRYKALGNSMAVPVMAWIGQRIAGLHNV